MTPAEADRLIDTLDIAPQPSFADLAAFDRRRLAELRSIRRDVNKLGREIEREIRINERVAFVCMFLAGLFAFVLFA